MKRFLYLAVLLFIFNFYACEEEFIPQDVQAKNEYVVEGHIEYSNSKIPAYVILSKSISYFSELNQETFKNLYVRDADVYVNDGEKDVKLKYVCAKNLPFQQVFKMVSELAGKIYDPDFCFYMDINDELKKEAGAKYQLRINHEGKEIFAEAKLPERVNIDSLHFEVPPGEPVDSFVLLWGTLNDPQGIRNYYRYFIKENLVNNYSYNSLRDDQVLDGKSIKFPFPRPVQPGIDSVNFETGNLYKRGDTIQFKFCSIDKGEYDFWQSFQFSKNQGLFSSYIRPKDNIEGGIGIWGAQNCQVVNLIVPTE